MLTRHRFGLLGAALVALFPACVAAGMRSPPLPQPPRLAFRAIYQFQLTPLRQVVGIDPDSGSWFVGAKDSLRARPFGQTSILSGDPQPGGLARATPVDPFGDSALDKFTPWALVNFFRAHPEQFAVRLAPDGAFSLTGSWALGDRGLWSLSPEQRGDNPIMEVAYRFDAQGRFLGRDHPKSAHTPFRLSPQSPPGWQLAGEIGRPDTGARLIAVEIVPSEDVPRIFSRAQIEEFSYRQVMGFDPTKPVEIPTAAAPVAPVLSPITPPSPPNVSSSVTEAPARSLVPPPPAADREPTSVAEAKKWSVAAAVLGAVCVLFAGVAWLRRRSA
ncbi:MAG: hypothetical protein SFY95_06295 [Planctomycetota bacterium]|nr:hypothetical protein [Planctomycetota bacterium]